MKVIVLGGGVVGVASAYYLHQAGHEVLVVERETGPALETSFANAGQVSWSYATPWMSPEVPWNAVKWMFRRYSPLRLRPRLDPAWWRWAWRALGNCRRARFLANRERMLRLARYSHDCLRQLREATGIHYDERMLGTLQLFRDARALDAAVRAARVLDDGGIEYRVLDRAGCLRVEPGLAQTGAAIAGGIHYPADETGDCHKFTGSLASLAEQAGVAFRYRTTVTHLNVEGGRFNYALTDKGRLEAEACVVAAGSYSPLLLRPLGIDLPVHPLKGYSATVMLTDEAAAPVSTLTDERYKVGITRMGERIRIAGIAELDGYSLSIPPARTRLLMHVFRQLFPRAADTERAVFWSGLRPMTPDNTPIIGPTPIRGLYLNTGHGTLGWTMSCGSGRLIADILSGRDPGIDLNGLTLDRYRG